MQKLINWLKYHWHERGFRVSTICGLVVLYLEIFHHTEFNHILDKAVDNPIIIGAIVSWLVGTNKF
jgi:hypothetical protein